jgi:hypothetical protein
MTKVFIAVPTYSGSPDIECFSSLVGTIAHLSKAGIPVRVQPYPGQCYIHLTRNIFTEIVRQDKSCTHLHFWDDDCGAPAEALLQLIEHDRDIVAAGYPKKQQGAGYEGKPFEWTFTLEDNAKPDERGLLPAKLLPTGFMLIKRQVIEGMCEFYKDRRVFDSRSGEEFYDLFPTGLVDFLPKLPDGNWIWWGEDNAFTMMAKRAGFQAWLDPSIPISHAGRAVWQGDFLAERAEAGPKLVTTNPTKHFAPVENGVGPSEVAA